VKRIIGLVAFLAIAVIATPVPASAQDMDVAMYRFASAWRRNDSKAISALIAREGAFIETPAGRFGPLGGRQAAAILRTLFGERHTTNVRTRQLQDVGGTPQKGYAELIWTSVAPETTEALPIVVFVEFVQESDREWRITRIRLLQR
jgi:hypothetical protein